MGCCVGKAIDLRRRRTSFVVVTRQTPPEVLLITIKSAFLRLQAEVRSLETETDVFCAKAKACHQPSLKHEFLASTKVFGALSNFFRRCQANPSTDSEVYFAQLKALETELIEFERTQQELEEKLAPPAAEEQQLWNECEALVQRWTKSFEDVKELLERVQALQSDLPSVPLLPVKNGPPTQDLQAKASDSECAVLLLTHICQRKFKQLKRRAAKLQASAELLSAIQASFYDSGLLRRKIESIIGTEEVYEETVNIDAVEEMMVAAENREAPVYYPHDEVPYYPTEEERLKDLDFSSDTNSEERKLSAPRQHTGSGTQESLEAIVDQIMKEGTGRPRRSEAIEGENTQVEPGESLAAPGPLSTEIRSEKPHNRTSVQLQEAQLNAYVQDKGLLTGRPESVTPRTTSALQSRGKVAGNKPVVGAANSSLPQSSPLVQKQELQLPTSNPQYVQSASLSNPSAKPVPVKPAQLQKDPSITNILKTWAEGTMDVPPKTAEYQALVSIETSRASKKADKEESREVAVDFDPFPTMDEGNQSLDVDESRPPEISIEKDREEMQVSPKSSTSMPETPARDFEPAVDSPRDLRQSPSIDPSEDSIPANDMESIQSFDSAIVSEPARDSGPAEDSSQVSDSGTASEPARYLRTGRNSDPGQSDPEEKNETLEGFNSPSSSLVFRREGIRPRTEMRRPISVDRLVLPAVPEEGLPIISEEVRKEDTLSSEKAPEGAFMRRFILNAPHIDDTLEAKDAAMHIVHSEADISKKAEQEASLTNEFSVPVITVLPTANAEPYDNIQLPVRSATLDQAKLQTKARNVFVHAMESLVRIQSLSAGQSKPKATAEDLKQTISAESDKMLALQADFKDMAKGPRPTGFRLHAEGKSALKAVRSGTQSSDSAGDMGRSMTGESRKSGGFEEEKKSGDWAGDYQKSSSGKRLHKTLEEMSPGEELKRRLDSSEPIRSESAVAEPDSFSSGSQRQHSEGRSAESRRSTRVTDFNKRISQSPDLSAAKDSGKRVSLSSYTPSGITIESQSGFFSPYETFAIFEETLRGAEDSFQPRSLIQSHLQSRASEEGGWTEWLGSLRNYESEGMAYATVMLCAVQETSECLPRVQAERFIGLLQDCNDLVRVVEADKAADSLSYGESSFSEEFEKIISTGGYMYWTDTLDLVYGRLPRRIGTLVIQAMKPESLPMADYVTFLTCHRMYESRLDGMQIFRQLDADTSGKLDAVEFSRGLQDLLQVWAPEADFKQAFQSLYNRWSGLVSKAQFSKQVNFAQYLQHTMTDLATISKYAFLQHFLVACRSLVKEALVALKDRYDPDSQLLMLQESEIRALAALALDTDNVQGEMASWRNQVERLGFELNFAEAKQAFVDALCR